MEVARDELVLAFEQWESDYRANPEGFWSDRDRLDETPRSYGEACADCLTDYLDQLPGR